MHFLYFQSETNIKVDWCHYVLCFAQKENEKNDRMTSWSLPCPKKCNQHCFSVLRCKTNLCRARAEATEGSINCNATSVIHSHRLLWVSARDFHWGPQKSNLGQSNQVKNIQIMSASLHITWLFGQIITSEQLWVRNAPIYCRKGQIKGQIPTVLIYFMAIQVYTHTCSSNSDTYIC